MLVEKNNQLFGKGTMVVAKKPIFVLNSEYDRAVIMEGEFCEIYLKIDNTIIINFKDNIYIVTDKDFEDKVDVIKAADEIKTSGHKFRRYDKIIMTNDVSVTDPYSNADVFVTSNMRLTIQDAYRDQYELSSTNGRRVICHKDKLERNAVLVERLK